MNTQIQEMVRRLAELHGLEDRLHLLQRNHEQSADVRARIETLRARIPVGVVAHHDRLRARGKRSMAEVRQGVCGGCHMRVAIGLIPVLRRRDSLIPCENCGRLLVLTEERPEHRVPASAAARPSAAIPS